jgi:hypothetical protein
MRDPIRPSRIFKEIGIGVFALVLLGICVVSAQIYTPVKWTKFVQVEGQSEPVPEQWLQDAEAKIAYSLKLPDSIPKQVPFNFTKAYWWSWLPGTPRETIQYFNHLCSTEAGQWIFKTVPKVEGFYFARPQNEPTTDVMTHPYGPEMPWIQRIFMISGNSLHDQGVKFVNPPFYNYRFIEQPRRETSWQKGINDPYVKLFGFTNEYFVKPGQVVAAWNERTPMQVAGIPALTADYGYTWRGIKRAQDRENGISGGELIIYDLQTKEVLAVRRQFLIAAHNPRGEGKAMWEVAASCPQVRAHPYAGEFEQFAFDILQTIEPSKTGK